MDLIGKLLDTKENLKKPFIALFDEKTEIWWTRNISSVWRIITENVDIYINIAHGVNYKWMPFILAKNTLELLAFICTQNKTHFYK